MSPDEINNTAKEAELQKIVNRLLGIFDQAGMSDIQELKAYRELARRAKRMKEHAQHESMPEVRRE